jgi:hypothetical protein
MSGPQFPTPPRLEVNGREVTPEMLNLVFAGPALYAALEAYTDEYGPKVSPGFSQDYDHARKLYAQARSALARARGEVAS